MKFDLTKVVLDMRGKPIPTKNDDGKDTDMTYQHLLQQLSVIDLKEDQDNFEAKNKKFKLALKVWGHGQIEMSNEDCVWLKERVVKVYNNTVLAGRLGEFLEAPLTEEKK